MTAPDTNTKADDWMPYDGEPKYPELADDDGPGECVGQIDIFGNVVAGGEG